MGKLKTHSPIYCIMDNWEKYALSYSRTRQNISDRHFMSIQINLHNDDNEMV